MKAIPQEILVLRMELRIWQAHVRQDLRQLKISMDKCRLIALRMRSIQRHYEAIKNVDPSAPKRTALLAGTGPDGSPLAETKQG